MALERPSHRGAFDDYDRRQYRLFDALSTLRPDDEVRFATVQKTWSRVVDVERDDQRVSVLVQGPRSARQYQLSVDMPTMERDILSRKTPTLEFQTHTAELNWIAIQYQDRAGQITLGYADGMKGTKRAQQLND